jgi:hypothetical protein
VSELRNTGTPGDLLIFVRTRDLLRLHGRVEWAPQGHNIIKLLCSSYLICKRIIEACNKPTISRHTLAIANSSSSRESPDN